MALSSLTLLGACSTPPAAPADDVGRPQDGALDGAQVLDLASPRDLPSPVDGATVDSHAADLLALDGALEAGLPAEAGAPADGGQPADTGVPVDTTALVDAPPPLPRLMLASNRHGHYDLFSVALDGSGLKRHTTAPGDDLHPAVSPDGTQVAFATTRTGRLQLALLQLSTGVVAIRYTGLLDASHPCFSPDGKTIVFAARKNLAQALDIFSVPLAGGPATQLTTHAAKDVGPAWAADGKTIYFVSTRGGSYEVWRMDPDGQNQQAVTSKQYVLGRPAVAADGLSLVFARSKPGAASTGQLVRFVLASQQVTVLAMDNDAEPALAGDGSALAYTTAQFGNPEVVLQPLGAAAPLVRLTTDPGIDGTPAFVPAAP